MEENKALAFQSAVANGAEAKSITSSLCSLSVEAESDELSELVELVEVLDVVELDVVDLGDEDVLDEVQDEEEEEVEVEGGLRGDLLVEVGGAMPLAALVLPMGL